MSKRKFLLTWILITLPMLALANTAADELDQQLTNLKSMQASFNQSILNKNGKSIQDAQGQMALQRPGKFRWNTIKPNKQLLIADGRYLWIYDADLAQVTKKRQTDNNGATPAMLLSGSTETLMQNFTITKINKSDNDSQWFQLVPKDQNNMFQSVQLGFKAGTLHEMRLVSSLGQTSVLKFSNVKVNPSLSNSLFRFSLPKGVDVVEQ